MKHSIIAFITILLITSLFSCSREIEQGLQRETEFFQREIKEIRATIGQFVCEDETSTRTTLVTDASDNLQLVWAENDTLGIFPAQGGQVAFPLGENAGEKTASFDGGGWGLKAESSYSAYYPLVGKFYLDQESIPLILSSQKQDGNGSFAHISKTDYMAASNVTVNANGGVDFLFSPLVALLHLRLQMPKRANYTLVALETSGEFHTEATLNLKTGVVTTTKKSPVQLLSLQNISFEEGENTPILEVYLTILPVNLSNKTISVKVFDEDQTCYSATLTARDFVQGTIYNYNKITSWDRTQTGLPVVLVNTPGNVAITSKSVYVKNTLISVLQPEIGDEFCGLTNIKGRGNSTWQAPKKPYAIKFDKKQPLLNMPEDKSWVLLANYYDPSLIRNDLVFYMGHEISKLDWTPHYEIVDLTLNGQYQGIYQLGEKVKVSKKRVNVGDDGFLLEVDNRASSESDARYFRTQHIPSVINIKEPEVEYNDANFNYIKSTLQAADAALYSENFTDLEEGWQKYMDIDSFVDWYIITEISRNADGCNWYSSCYMNCKRGGKLKMGPLWDYDLGFGAYPSIFNAEIARVFNQPEGFSLKNSAWYSRLFEDPAFVSKVKERFSVYYSMKQELLNYIDSREALLTDKVVEDNKLWGTITYKSVAAPQVATAYHQKIVFLKNWLSTRLDWLNENISSL